MCPSTPLSSSCIDFNADDREILKHLGNMENGLPLPTNVIPDVSPCTFAPWDLPEKMFYLITWMEEEAEPKVIEHGYWKDSRKIRIEFVGFSTVGWKTTWVFYGGQPPKEYRTPWTMHEYRMEEKGSYLLYRVFSRDAGADDDSVGATLMHMLDSEESNAGLVESEKVSQVVGSGKQHGQSGASSNSFQNAKVDLFSHGPHSPEDYMELDDLLASFSSSKNSFIASVNSDDSFDYMELNDLQASSSSSKSSFNALVNSDDSFDPDAVLRGLQSGETTRDVSSSRQQHSNHNFNVSVSTNSDDGFDPEAVLRELEHEEVRRDVPNRRQQHSNPGFNVPASSNSFDGFNSDDGFVPEALRHELPSEETATDALNRGQQHCNSRFNASAPMNSDVGVVPGALTCQLQSGQMSRGVSSKGQQHVNHRFNISACQGSHPMVMKPEHSGSPRSSNDVPAKEIIRSATRPTSMKVQGAHASLTTCASFESPVSVPPVVQRTNQGPSPKQDAGSHHAQAYRKKSPGGMAKLGKMLCCFMPN